MIAHRGVHSTGATENTLQAFEAAVELGADMIELDVRRTGAGELAILHDHRLGDVALDSCSLDEFEQRTGFRPPLLTNVLAWADGRIGLDVELKEDGYAEQVAPLLSEFAGAGNELLVTSFLDPLLAQLSAIAPRLRLGLLMMWTAEGAGQRAGAAGARTVLPEMKLVDEPLIEAITSAGLELIVWDFMAADHAQLLRDERVAGVITDDVPGAMAAPPSSTPDTLGCMSDRRPVIGIATALERAQYGLWDGPCALLQFSYVEAIQRADALALMLPPDPALVENPDEVLDRIDALVLAGGCDIDPAHYGQEPHPSTTGIVPPRDEFELALLTRAIERDMPTLCVCRGMQLLNIVRGGTLVQHLPDVLHTEEHRRNPGTFDGNEHDVAACPRLARRAGRRRRS